MDLEDGGVEYVCTLAFTQVILTNVEFSLATCIGEYELVLSDHNSVVDMCCVEGMCTFISAPSSKQINICE